MKLTRTLITLLLCFLLVLCANGQLVHFTHQYTIEDGLANRSVIKIIRDNLGKTWLVSRTAIQIYDGANFKTLKHDIPCNFEDNILIDRIGPTTILIVKDDQSWVIDTAKETVSRFSTNAKSKYFASENMLIELNKNNGTIKTNDDILIQDVKDLDIETIKTSGQTHIAILTTDSLLYSKVKQEELYQVDKIDKLIGIINKNTVYIKDDSLFFFDPISKMSRYQKHDEAIKYALIRKDKKRNAMLATSNNSRRFLKFSLYTKDGQSDYSELAQNISTIRDFYSDDFSKDILLATYNGLVYHSFSNSIAKYNYDSSLKSSQFGNVIWWVIERETTGDIYFSKESKGFYQIKGDSSELVNPYQTNRENTFTANYFGTYHSATDKLFSLSLNTNQTVLHSWDFVNDPIDIPLPGRYLCLNSSDNRYLLLGGRIDTVPHLLTIDTRDNTITNQKNIEGIGKSIYCIEHQDNYTYYGTNTGCYRIQQSTEELDTLTQDPSLYILANESQMIVGTDGNGLQIYENGKLISTLKTDNGLPDNLVHSLTSNAGHIWASTNKGITVLDSTYRIIKNIRIDDGLTTSELNTKSLLSAGSKIYAGSINGLNVIENSILNYDDTYPLVLDKVSMTDENDLTVSKNYLGHNSINLEYGVENFDIHFNDYQLYKSVFDRDYIFKNQYSIDDSIYCLDKNLLPIELKENNVTIDQIFDAKNQYSIEIKRQTFFQRFSSVILLSILILFLLASLYLLNRKRVKERQNLKLKSVNNKLTAMRASALRAQMNPHFIFNALGSIQYYIQREEIEKAEEYLSDFSVLMRSTLESSKEDYTKISTELEMLTLYLKLEHLRFEEKFEYSLEVDENIDQSLQIPSMVIQPFIENAINHGIYHLSDRKGLIRVILFEDKDELINCKIEDNGIGRDASKLYRKKKHKSRALSNIDERIKIINSLNGENLAIKVTDKFTDGKAEGTEVRIQFGIIPD